MHCALSYENEAKVAMEILGYTVGEQSSPGNPSVLEGSLLRHRQLKGK